MPIDLEIWQFLNDNDPSHTRLSIFYKSPPRYEIEHLARAIAQNKVLTTLELTGNNLGPEGMRHLAPAIVQNKVLTALGLRFEKIGPEGMQHLARAIAQNEVLTGLELTGNDLGPEGMRHLAPAIVQNKVLTALELSYNKIGPEGMRHLAPAIAQNKSLTTLHLRSNNLGPEGIKILYEALKHNRTLTSLQFDCPSNNIECERIRDELETLVLKNLRERAKFSFQNPLVKLSAVTTGAAAVLWFSGRLWNLGNTSLSIAASYTPVIVTGIAAVGVGRWLSSPAGRRQLQNGWEYTQSFRSGVAARSRWVLEGVRHLPQYFRRSPKADFDEKMLQTLRDWAQRDIAREEVKEDPRAFEHRQQILIDDLSVHRRELAQVSHALTCREQKNELQIATLSERLRDVPLDELRHQQTALEFTIRKSTLGVHAERELELIEKDPALNDYYYVFLQLLQGTWIACMTINSKLIKQKNTLMTNALEIIQEIANQIPGAGFITKILVTLFNTWDEARRHTGIQRMANYFGVGNVGFEVIAACARQLTLAKQSEIQTAAATKPGLAKSIWFKAKTTLLADDINTLLRETAAEDFKLILLAIMEAKIKIHPKVEEAEILVQVVVGVQYRYTPPPITSSPSEQSLTVVSSTTVPTASSTTAPQIDVTFLLQQLAEAVRQHQTQHEHIKNLERRLAEVDVVRLEERLGRTERDVAESKEVSDRVRQLMPDHLFFADKADLQHDSQLMLQRAAATSSREVRDVYLIQVMMVIQQTLGDMGVNLTRLQEGHGLTEQQLAELSSRMQSFAQKRK